jgi:uncharacterized repeat protein (TIGR01451 family)
MSTQYKRTHWVQRLEDFSSGNQVNYQRKWWLRIGAAAVIGGVLSTSAWAYDVKIRFNDMYNNQPVSGLNVTAGGQTATWADNYYVVSGLAEGTYTLSMSTTGYKPFTDDFEVGSNHPHHVFNARYAIKTVNGYRIEGQVIDGNNGGALLAGVQVSTNGASTITGNDGKFVLDFSTATTYSLTFAKSGYLSVSGNYGVSDSIPRKYTGSVSLMNGYTVTGKVQDIDKQGIAGVTVSIAGQTVTTSGDGTFTVSGIKQYGSQTVTLSKNGQTLERTVNIPQANPTVSAGTFYLVDSYVIQGQVLTVKNEAAVGLTVVSGNVSDTTDDNGMYLLRIPNSGTHTVTLEHSGYKQVSTSVGVSDTIPNATARYALYAIDINDGYYIYGNIKLADPDVPASAITIEVPKSDGSKITTQPDDEGNFVLQGLQEGGSYNATVKVAKEGFATVTKSFSVNNGKVQAGLGTFDFTPKVVMSMVEGNTRRDLGNDMVGGGSKVFKLKIENQGAGPINNVRLFADPALPGGFYYDKVAVVAPLGLPLANTLCGGPHTTISAGGIFELTPKFPTPTYPPDCGGTKLDCGSLIVLAGRSMTNNSLQNCEPINGLGCEMFVDVTVASCGSGGGGGTYQPWQLDFQATGIGCEDYGISICSQNGGLDGVEVLSSAPLKTITEVIPQFSMGFQETATQTQIGGNLDYKVIVDNAEVANAAVTNATLQIQLPDTVELASATLTAENNTRRVRAPNYGNCEETGGKTVTCYLDTLPIGGTSVVDFSVKTVRVGQGRIDFTLDSDQTEPQKDSTSNFSVLPVPPEPPPMPVGDADLMFVIDDTGSMTEELNALIQAVNEFIAVYGQSGPNVGLVTFKDEVTNRIRSNTGGLSATNNMNWLLNGYSNYITGIKQLRADLGADCPEAALKALNYAKDHVKVGGRMILVTDASSHPDVEVDALITALRSKGVRLDVILSGEECVGMCGVDTGEANKDSISAIETYSRIAKETGGLFATPFEVNDNTTSGAKHYQKVALNLLLGSVRPTITSVLPNKVPQGVSVDLTLTAANTNFTEKSVVNFGEGIQVNSVNVLSSTELQMNVTVANSATVDFHDITITTPRGEEAAQIEEAKGLGVLEIIATSEQPAILSITPNSVSRDGKATIEITTANTNLGTGTILSFADNANIGIQKVTVNSPTRLTATLDVTNAELGSHPITLKTGSEELATQCTMTASPASGSLLITPSLEEGNVPRLSVEPQKGAQGAVRRIDITGANTHFQSGLSELRFSGEEEVYVLEFTVFNETQAQALIQINTESTLGYKDIYIYSGDEFASALDGFEVTAKCGYTLVGYLLDVKGLPIADVQLDTGEHLAFSNENGYFQAEGLCEGEYEAKLSKDGNEFDPVPFIVSENTAVNGVVKLPIEAPSSTLVVQSKPDAWRIYQGETITYTITTTNHGEITATNVVLAEQLPAETELVSVEALGGGQCQENTEAHLVTCELPDLGANREAVVKITVKAMGTNRLVNEVIVTASEYPGSTDKNWTAVYPYLSVQVNDDHDPVVVGSTLFYNLTVELSPYLADKEGIPTTATGVTLVSDLPSGVRLESVQSEQANCEVEPVGNSNTVTCQIVDLSIDNPTDISQVQIDMAVAIEDAGLLLLVHEAKVMSNEFPIHMDRERTSIFIPDDIEVDMAFVIDVTGSMQGEMNGVIKALTEFTEEIDASTAPLMALVTFGDEVKVAAFTRNIDVLRGAIEDLTASGGGLCEEASVEALLVAIPHTKAEGDILFSTDASPYADADVEQVLDLLKDKAIHFNAFITGDCSMKESWNTLPQ